MFYVSEVNKNVNFPCFFLAPEGWDDYSYKTEFTLYYCPNKKTEQIKIGFIKIISKNLKIEVGDKDAWVKDLLPLSFEELGENFVSHGQDSTFYYNMHQYLGKENGELYLLKLRDCCFSRNFLDGFPRHLIKDSLLRSTYSEQMLVDGKYIIREQNKDTVFHFTFDFIPPYDIENSVEIKFNFDQKDNYFKNSIYCLIGENGVGKTEVLKNLPQFIHDKKIDFNRIIHISNNLYEHLRLPSYEGNPEYQYLGIVSKKDGIYTVLNRIEQHEQINSLLKEIVKRYKNEACKEDIRDGFMYICELFRNRIDLSEFFLVFDSDEMTDEHSDEIFSRFLKSYDLLSSGESILLYNLIRTLRTITYYSLFLIDEPEIHLHPNFISDYMRFLYLMLKRFQSYAVIATHSVFVVREVKSSCVYLIQRQDNHCYVCEPPRETLGANAMTLYEDVFRTIDSNPYYMLQINNMISDGYSEEKIINSLALRPDSDLDLGLKMEIHYLVKEHEEHKTI